MEYLAPLQYIGLEKQTRRTLPPHSSPSLRTNLAGHDTWEWNNRAHDHNEKSGPTEFNNHTSTGPRSSTFYAHANTSGVFHPPRTDKKSTLRRQHKRSIQRASFTRKTPLRSLVRNRMKLWNLTWLSNSMLRIQEEKELEESLEDNINQPRLKLWTSESLLPSQLYLPPSHLSTEGTPWSPRPGKTFPRCSESYADWPSDPIPACPMSIIDEGSDSSGSDEDLDTYNFDLSSCFPTPPLVEDFDGVVDKALSHAGNQTSTHSSTKRTKSNTTSRSRRTKTPKVIIRRGGDHEVDISSVYASIMRDTSLMRPSWM